MNPLAQGVAAGGFITILLFVIIGFGSVEITEYALNSSLLTRKVDSEPFASGRYWISPFNHFVRFPAIVKTIQFSDSTMQSDLHSDEQGDKLLRSRTKDGLDVLIELSFQYQLKKEQIFDLYTTLGPSPDYHNTFVRIAIDRLTEIATTYTANQFFMARTDIGKDMEQQLQKDFQDRLFASVFSFQLRSVGLPTEFEDAIQETEVMKQDVRVAQAEQSSTKVSLETQLMQAKRRTQVAASQAQAKAKSLMLANSADIAQYNIMQEKSADSYAGILKTLDSKEPDMLAYMETRVLRDHPSELTTLGVGLPAPTSR